MANKKIDVTPISSEKILSNIKNAGYSIRSIAGKTDWSEWSIRNYLKRGKMPEKLIKQLYDIVDPKKYLVRIQFNVLMGIGDIELDRLKMYDECIEKPHDTIEVCDYDAEYLWQIGGGTMFENAVIDCKMLRSYIREKSTSLDGNEITNEEVANYGKGEVQVLSGVGSGNAQGQGEVSGEIDHDLCQRYQSD